MKKTSIVLAAMAVCLVANLGYGATVQLSLVLDPAAPGCTGCTLSGAGTYNLVAKASQGDNFGISFFSIPVVGISSAINRSPRTLVDPEGDALPAGFTLARSANNQVVIPGGFLIGGGQDTALPTPHLIRGFGQEAGSFANKLGPGVPVGAPQTQTTWAADLVLAEGSYLAGAAPKIDFANVDILVNAFVQANGLLTAAATLGGGVPPINPIVNDLVLPANSVVNATVGGTVTGTDVATWSPTLEFLGYTQNYGGQGQTGVTQPSVAPIWNPANQSFSWDTTNSLRGDYVWRVTGSNTGGDDTGLISIAQQAVPEPTTFALLGLAAVAFVGCRRK